MGALLALALAFSIALGALQQAGATPSPTSKSPTSASPTLVPTTASPTVPTLAPTTAAPTVAYQAGADTAQIVGYSFVGIALFVVLVVVVRFAKTSSMVKG